MLLSPGTPGTWDGQMPSGLLKFPIDQRTLSRSTSVPMARQATLSNFLSRFFFLDGCSGKLWLCKSQVSRVALFRRLLSHAVEIKSEKLGIPVNTEYQPFHFTDWHSFLVNGNLRAGVLLPFFVWGWAIFLIVFCGNIFFLQFTYKMIQCLRGINVRGCRKFNKL